MNRYLVITFPDEKAAYEGSKALQSLHADGDISLYGQAVLAADADGKIEVRDVDDPGPVGTAIGALTGGLIGLIGGPAGFVVGAAGGGLIGSLTDLDNAGVGWEFAGDVAQELKPGSAAVVAEVSEDWVLPVETRMEALGGQVYRKARIDVEDEQLVREIDAWNAEMDALDAELAQADAEMREKIEAKKTALRRKIETAQQKADARIKEAKSDAEAKLAALRDQMTSAGDKARAAIENRLVAIQADRDARLGKLSAARELISEALMP